MKKILFLFLFLPLISNAQLKEFEVKEREKPRSGNTVQANTDLPDNALIFVYSSLKDLNFRSSLQGINKQSYNQTLNRYEIFVSPFKQNLSVTSPGFIVSDLATISPSPKEVFYFSVEEKVSASLLGKSQLKFNSNPSDVVISINDLETNYRTPFDREVNAGLTKITLKKDKYLTFQTLFNLMPDRVTDLNFKLTPQWIDLSISVKPEAARIQLNNKIVGTGIVEFKGIEQGLNPGEYNLTVDFLNHRTYSQNLNLKSGQVENLTIDLQPILGRLKVNSDTESAQVILNGNQVGITPFDKEILIGDYNLLLKKDGFRDETKSFKLSEGMTQDVSVEMLNYAKVLNPLKTKATFSYLVGIVGLGSGLYLMQSANQNYKAYQEATTAVDAASLRDKVESADQLSPIALGIGGVGLLGGVIFSSKIKKYKRNWDLVAVPSVSGGFFALTHRF
jgi:hypothetical protein